MKMAISYLVFVFGFMTFCGCSASKPSEQQIFDIIKSESVIAKYDYFVLQKVSLKSSTIDGKRFKALVTIEFLFNHGSDRWMREGEKDFIPSMSKIQSGKNSLDATAVFLKYDDGTWHLEGFSI